MITTLVVKPVDRKCERSGFGAGIDWKRRQDGAIDLTQDAVRDWVDALRCLVKCRTVRTGRHRVRHLSIRWGCERSNLRDYEAFAIGMLFLKVAGIPVESLDLHTVDFWELESACETFPKQTRVDRVFPSPSRNKRTRPAPWAHLQSLALTNILHIDHGARFANLVASARALKSLKLAGVPDGFSFKILSSRANRFQLERLEVSGMHRTPIQMPAFLNALRKHRRTLKNLALADSTLHDHARWSEVFRTLRLGGFSALQEFSMERLFEGPDHLGVSYIPGTMIVDGPKGAVLSWTLHQHRHRHPNNNHNGNGNGTNPGALPSHRVYYGAIGYSGPGVWRLFRRLEGRAVRRDPRDYSPSVPVIHRF